MRVDKEIELLRKGKRIKEVESIGMRRHLEYLISKYKFTIASVSRYSGIDARTIDLFYKGRLLKDQNHVILSAWLVSAQSYIERMEKSKWKSN